MTQSQAALQVRIDELIAKGWTARAAERHARKERRIKDPRHQAAVQRRVEAATVCFEATGDFKVFNLV